MYWFIKSMADWLLVKNPIVLEKVSKNGGNVMEFLNLEYVELIEKLVRKNLYMELSRERQQEIDNRIIQHVKNKSLYIEEKIGSELQGVEVVITDECKFYVNSELCNTDKYRGKITISRLFIVAMYQMFFEMDYSRIVIDGKGIDNIKDIMFHWSITCILEHELAHIYKGHLALIHKWGVQREYIDVQTLEWDADAFAATYLATLCTIGRKALQGDTTDFIVKMVCGAVHGMMFWQRKQEEFRKIETGNHLPIFYREMAMYSTMGDLLKNSEKLINYMQGYEMAFANFWREDKRKAFMYFSEAKDHVEWLYKVEDNWEKIKSELQPFSILPLEELTIEGFKRNLKGVNSVL